METKTPDEKDEKPVEKPGPRAFLDTYHLTSSFHWYRLDPPGAYPKPEEYIFCGRK